MAFWNYGLISRFTGFWLLALILYSRRPVFSYVLLNSRETIFFYRVLIYSLYAGINAGLWPATLFWLVYAFWAGFPLSNFE